MFKKIKNAIKKFGEFIQMVVNFILIAVFYFVVIGLVSIIARLFGKKFLDYKKNGWIDTKNQESIKNASRMF